MKYKGKVEKGGEIGYRAGRQGINKRKGVGRQGEGVERRREELQMG